MRQFLLILLLLTSTLAYSQNKSNHAIMVDIDRQEHHIVSAYTDSLARLRNQIDSLIKENRALKGNKSTDPRYMRLFTPVNFYGDLAHRHFSLNEDEAMTTDDQMVIDNALMNVYINHPELVRGRFQGERPKRQKEEKKEEPAKKDAPPASYEAPKAEEISLAPVDIVIVKPNFWTFSGDYYLQMMQNFYSGNWYQGGESNYSALTRVTLRANYNNKQKFKWENTLEMQLGFMTNKSDTVHSVKTSSDLLRLTSKVGLQATKKWYYTLQVVANSQFMRSFKANSDVVKSDFGSPLNINVSLGMDYNINWLKGKLTGSVHLAPFAANYKYFDRLNLAQANGFDEGKHGKLDFGNNFEIRATWKFSNNVNWSTRLYGYTTYHRMDLQWENTFNMKISRFLTASIYVYPRFDDSNISRKDDDFGYFQLMEYTSLGLSYSF